MAPNAVRFPDGRLATKNLVPGVRVYREDLIRTPGGEFRGWNPLRSKLAAAILNKHRTVPLREDSRVLYLGASTGTTPSHVSDIVTKGRLYAVEVAPGSFRKLLALSARRPNMVPILADGARPALWRRLVGAVDVLYQDVAQRDQVGMFLGAAREFRPAHGILMLKAKSVDVARPAKEVFEETVRRLEAEDGVDVERVVDLHPFEREHAALLVRFAGAGSGKPAAGSGKPGAG
ncbi:MAG: fibrillarin-like rRNA/tRNA 2'-O-methyltransferase [Methanobacteriota archaeon]